MIAHHPFFILGYERSGTTLLATLLDRHPEIAVPPETHFVNDTVRRFRFSGRTLPVGQIVSAMKQNHRMVDLHMDWDAFQQELPETELEPQEVFARMLRRYANAKGKRFVGEKTPHHMYHVERVVEWFPRSRIIWIIRDGRDVVLSLKRAPWIHSSVRRHSVKWVSKTRKMMEVAAKSENALSVKYEDLLQNPVREMQRIHEHLGVPFVVSQLDPAAGSDVAPDWEAEWKGKVYEGIDPSRAFSWKRDAGQNDLQVMESVMAPLLQELGYPSDRVRSNVWTRVSNGSLNLAYRGIFASPLTGILRILAEQVGPRHNTQNS